MESDDASQLTGILPGPARSKRRTLVVDGEAWRDTSADALSILGIQAQSTVDLDALSQTLQEAESRASWDRALRILDRRDRSAGEMRSRLAMDGYPPDIVAGTIDRLLRTGLVDDERLAEAIVVALLRDKDYGRHRIAHELKRRLISSELAVLVLNEFAPAESEDERALYAARRMIRPSADVDGLTKQLARRGFSWGAARRAAIVARDTTQPD